MGNLTTTPQAADPSKEQEPLTLGTVLQSMADAMPEPLPDENVTCDEYLRSSKTNTHQRRHPHPMRPSPSLGKYCLHFLGDFEDITTALGKYAQPRMSNLVECYKDTSDFALASKNWWYMESYDVDLDTTSTLLRMKIGNQSSIISDTYFENETVSPDLSHMDDCDSYRLAFMERTDENQIRELIASLPHGDLSSTEAALIPNDRSLDNIIAKYPVLRRTWTFPIEEDGLAITIEIDTAVFYQSATYSVGRVIVEHLPIHPQQCVNPGAFVNPRKLSAADQSAFQKRLLQSPFIDIRVNTNVAHSKLSIFLLETRCKEGGFVPSPIIRCPPLVRVGPVPKPKLAEKAEEEEELPTDNVDSVNNQTDVPK